MLIFRVTEGHVLASALIDVSLSVIMGGSSSSGVSLLGLICFEEVQAARQASKCLNGALTGRKRMIIRVGESYSE